MVDNIIHSRDHNTQPTVEWDETLIAPELRRRRSSTNVAGDEEINQTQIMSFSKVATTCVTEQVADVPQKWRRDERKLSGQEKRAARRRTQHIIMQFLIDANSGRIHINFGEEQWIEYHSGRIRLVHLNRIAEHINRSPESARRFLRIHSDDMWSNYNDDETLWYTPFHILPDRLLW